MKNKNIFIIIISLLIVILVGVIIINVTMLGQKNKIQKPKEPDKKEETSKNEILTTETAEKFLRDVYSLQNDENLKLISEDEEYFVFETTDKDNMKKTYKINRKTKVVENTASASISSGSSDD